MIIRVGMGSCGIAAGANNVWNAISEKISSNNLNITLQKTGCNGMCFREPLVDVIVPKGDIYTYGNVELEKIDEIIDSHIYDDKPITNYLISSEAIKNFIDKQQRIALRNTGIINPEKIDDYIQYGGYDALKMCLEELTPSDIIEEIKTSGLRGRGGAGFPTWFKWESTRNEKSAEKYIVCNADEGDPGAFMDRSILESDPHTLLEGMAIAGYATGATIGIIYVRAEYPLAIERLETAIEQAREKGLLGKIIFNKDFNFDIWIKQGAGAFVCGEETALIASLEGERGMPKLKPPFPSQKGYWNQPTSINNVETLANVPWIINNRGSSFSAMGTEDSKGTKVFALAGKVKHGGLVEVPMGISLREVIFTVGGGIKGNKKFKAVQLGGPSGGCIPLDLLDIPVDYESINNTGAIMGSGGMIVVDDSTCMVDIARFFLDFTQKESCGKCVQCRIGTKRMLEVLERISEGDGKQGDIELLEHLSSQIKEGSLCGLGQSAPNPVLTTIKYFRDEYEAHINDRVCPAKHCKSLITYKIDQEKCKGCGLCKKKCPTDCIIGEKKEVHVIEQEHCIKCGSCLTACPDKFAAVEIV
ncbi:Electron-bifurcating [FeFe]-hydrogenase subunit B (NAD+ reductase, ferredoxin reductase) [Candidatus Syntrophocurvum alkaliphilum]|uniref:Electron-bifurcating [FeFe]-hydrogenase subunit B (NAD+ reductase, ferredoxin reductase) n=1 Tax=Candidatus Syntrophocurvum alkaliphilum TaxID=2293317 RepID=A0A6I6DD37_9FIRM|nr:NADH-quinone oxidoreductase subunit NuoF [Candidatus Syntrophocurvum alkaliphilum]QGT99020.1 Electron-bifurcating [FeFe]-hydrogenase subunit B (NAD+ reductase, ferredoxin reductase) [Candidatus Syntrophocurvum alkaliphilum]